MSEADIDAGDRWGQEVTRELGACNFGIICVTPENLTASWLLFEAGALAKSLEGSKLIPLLFDLELRDISGPLAQFQAKKFDKAGLSEVANSINKALSNPIGDASLKTLLDAMWVSFQQKIEAVPSREQGVKRARNQADILEDLVVGVRSFDSRLRETEMALSDQVARPKRRKRRLFMPMILDTLAETEGEDPLGLLVLAGILREEFPWMSEVLIETYRELRGGSPRSIRHLPERIHRLSRMMMRGPLMEEIGGSAEEGQMMIMELPMLLQRYVSRLAYERSKSDRTSAKTVGGSIPVTEINSDVPR